MNRRICSQCALDYNVVGRRTEERDVCDTCGGRLVKREDDTPEALAARMRGYHEKTKPIIEFLERKEFVSRVDACGKVDEVYAEIRRGLGLSPAAVGKRRCGHARPDS